MLVVQWSHNAAEKTAMHVLKTVDHILENANSHLTSGELDDLKDCWKILCKLCPGEKMLAK